MNAHSNQAAVAAAARPRAYNTARRYSLVDPAHREEMLRDYDLAEGRGDADLALWARAWGPAIRDNVIGRHDGWRHQDADFHAQRATPLNR